MKNENTTPEFASLDAFMEFLLEEDRDSFTFEEVTELNRVLQVPFASIRAQLQAVGFKYETRPKTKEFRTFSANSHNRWTGNPCGGGSGWESIIGMAPSRQ
jgi:hypothetical protein